MTEDFYVGYQPHTAPRLASFIRRTVVSIGLLTAAVAVGVSITQGPFAASQFAYGEYRSVTGRMVGDPYPMLLTGTGPMLLVAPWKRGLPDVPPHFAGSTVSLKGALIKRDSTRMLEVQPGSIQLETESGSPITSVTEPRHVSLIGEIVDSKCYLGVMNPGEGKVHRDCAARCISGGIPPAFAFRDATGNQLFALLTSANPNQQFRRELLPYVAEPVRVSGQLETLNGVLTLRTSPNEIRRE